MEVEVGEEDDCSLAANYHGIKDHRSVQKSGALMTTLCPTKLGNVLQKTRVGGGLFITFFPDKLTTCLALQPLLVSPLHI
jgi:hypothetical protein